MEEEKRDIKKLALLLTIFLKEQNISYREGWALFLAYLCSVSHNMGMTFEELEKSVSIGLKEYKRMFDGTQNDKK